MRFAADLVIIFVAVAAIVIDVTFVISIKPIVIADSECLRLSWDR